jgi:hypothetical protein
LFDIEFMPTMNLAMLESLRVAAAKMSFARERATILSEVCRSHQETAISIPDSVIRKDSLVMSRLPEPESRPAIKTRSSQVLKYRYSAKQSTRLRIGQARN